MNHPYQHDTDDGSDVRKALATLVAEEPVLPSGIADIERRGRRRVAIQRLGIMAAVVALGAAGVSAGSLLGGAPTEVAQPSDVAVPIDTTDPAGGSMLADGFPIGSAVNAVAAALPGGLSLGELPMDISWRANGRLDVPLLGPVGPGEPPAPTYLLTIQVADGACAATVDPAGALSDADLSAIADAVCAEWVANGSPAVIPGGQAGEERPDLANK